MDERGIEAVQGVDFDLRAGEIFGIAGVDGNGQSELVEVITGLRDSEEGRIVFEGEDITHWHRRRIIDAGMSFIPEDRQERGLVMPFDLIGNGLLGSQRREPFVDGHRLDWRQVRGHAEEIIEGLRRPARRTRPRRPSRSPGGNQQKFVVGREFEREPRLLVASNPTRGVDIGSIEFIHQQLLDRRSEDVAILLVSSKLDEVMALSDRFGRDLRGSS
ncbi:MAG: ATP-binding cassette domain-containing protein [Halobacteriales archaeon]|nr:ATP-binding cassette domain-containing protein [Halobacteriales archaeon]